MKDEEVRTEKQLPQLASSVPDLDIGMLENSAGVLLQDSLTPHGRICLIWPHQTQCK
jgi:hypothetical protein